jgi:hypothetical protein
MVVISVSKETLAQLRGKTLSVGIDWFDRPVRVPTSGCGARYDFFKFDRNLVIKPVLRRARTTTKRSGR